jgi:hypothetical protein
MSLLNAPDMIQRVRIARKAMGHSQHSNPTQTGRSQLIHAPGAEVISMALPAVLISLCIRLSVCLPFCFPFVVMAIL